MKNINIVRYSLAFIIISCQYNISLGQYYTKKNDLKIFEKPIFNRSILLKNQDPFFFNETKNVYLPLSSTVEKKCRHYLIPIIAFGLVGFWCGAFIGTKIDPPKGGHIPGEIPDISNVSTGVIIGASLGTITGGFIGYILYKKEKK